MCLRGKTAKYRKVEEVWPPLKFNFTYWVVFSGWFGQENYEKLCHFGLGLSSLALDIWRLDIWRLQTSFLKIPATKKVETPQVILLRPNGIPGILTIAWDIFSQLMTTEDRRVALFVGLSDTLKNLISTSINIYCIILITSLNVWHIAK